MPPDSLRLLLVDDHEGQRALLRGMLEALDVRDITEAASGNAAIALLDRPDYRPDLVISDLNMRDGDGFDVLRAVAQRPRAVPLAIVSSVDEDVLASVARIQDPHATLQIHAIAKPVTLDRLCELLAGLHPRQRRSAPVPLAGEDIARGIASREFVAFLEPKVDLRNDRVVGFEALARWRHPQRGLIAPSDFIPVIELSGQMPAFTIALFDDLLATRARLYAAGFRGRLSINIGAECLAEPEFPSRMHDCLLRHQLSDGRGLTLELTESSALHDPVDAISGLARLRLLGFELAIDDFGIGHSSLANMRNAAFSEIKIDRQFTSRVLTDRLSRAAIESVIHIALSLGWHCVAEGIETETIRRALVSMGCTTGQGYLFSAPIAPQDAVPWWQRRHGHATAAAAIAPPEAERPPSVAETARREGCLLVDVEMMAQLEKRDVPSWLFDLDRFRIRWANSAGLRLWKAPSLAALIERDFGSDLSATARSRLSAYRGKLTGGRVVTERWTLYPLGEPVANDCLLTGVMTPDGHHAMLVEAFRAGSLVDSTVFEVETANAVPCPILTLDGDGRILWRNPAATLGFGAGTQHFAALFEDALTGESLLADTRAAGECRHDAVLHALEGPCWQRIQLRTARHPHSGATLIVASLTPVDDLLRGPQRRAGGPAGEAAGEPLSG